MDDKEFSILDNFEIILKYGEYKFFYLIYAKFDFKQYKELRKEEHSNWSENQVKCVLYWQNSVKKLLSEFINMLTLTKQDYILGCGYGLKIKFRKYVGSMENSCINVFSTCKLNGIKLEIRPKNIIYLVCLLCSKKPVSFKKQLTLEVKKITAKVQNKNSSNIIFTLCGTPIANSYVRIEHGRRGKYVEFKPSQIIWSNLYIPDYALERIGKPYYYLEYRTKDKCNVMVYHQKRKVDYANYKIGLLYISPKGLTRKILNLDNFINRLRCEQYDTKIFKITKFREIANEIIEEVVILEGFCPNDYDDNPYDILEYDDFHIEELAKLIINHSEVENLLGTDENERLDEEIKSILSFENESNFQDFLDLQYEWLYTDIYFNRFFFKLCELSETRYNNLHF